MSVLFAEDTRPVAPLACQWRRPVLLVSMSLIVFTTNCDCFLKISPGLDYETDVVVEAKLDSVALVYTRTPQ